MKRKFKTCKLQNIDMDKINTTILYEAILTSPLEYRKNYEVINSQIDYIATTPYIPHVSTMEQYDAIVELISIKEELTKIYNLFEKWYENLKDKELAFFIAYFVDKDFALCREMWGFHFRERIFKRMLTHFMEYIKRCSDLTEEELVKNPFIYDIYSRIQNSKYKTRKRKAEFEGENEHDNTADERCHY